MTSTEFSVPDELLRAGQRPTTRTRGEADRVALLMRGAASAAASLVMFPLTAAPVAIVAVVAGRAVLTSTVKGVKRLPVAGATIAGLVGGVVATSAINDALGKGWTSVAGLACGAAGAITCVLAARLRVVHGDAPSEPPA